MNISGYVPCSPYALRLLWLIELEWEYQFRELGGRILNAKNETMKLHKKLNPGTEYPEQRNIS